MTYREEPRVGMPAHALVQQGVQLPLRGGAGRHLVLGGMCVCVYGVVCVCVCMCMGGGIDTKERARKRERDNSVSRGWKGETIRQQDNKNKKKRK